jgi:hypothetical protein
MSWTSPTDIRQHIQKLWDKGALLASVVNNEALFPRRIPLKAPTSTQLLERFDEARRWGNTLREQRHVRVEMREFRHRVLGANALPGEVWLDTLEDALALIGKQRDTDLFGKLVESTRARLPALLPWMAKRPLRVLELAAQWGLLLDIVQWLQARPRPGIYLRQLDLPGVHSKFIEAHRATLSELLDAVLPGDAIDATATGAGQFARRYGFRDKPEHIRFRMLDPKHNLLPGRHPQDLSLDAASFAQLPCSISRVFISENEINFLAFPAVANAMAIFGAGYGFETLRKATWLNACRIYYWGDIDTHGFAILSALRSHFAHVESLLMDAQTLYAFESLWGHEHNPTQRDLPRLRPDEQALYDQLRNNCIRPQLRLEQEHIALRWLQAALAADPALDLG